MLSNSFTFSIEFKQDTIKPWHIQWPTSDIFVRQPSFKQEVHVQIWARFRNVYKYINSTQRVIPLIYNMGLNSEFEQDKSL